MFPYPEDTDRARLSVNVARRLLALPVHPLLQCGISVNHGRWNGFYTAPLWLAVLGDFYDNVVIRPDAWPVRWRCFWGRVAGDHEFGKACAAVLGLVEEQEQFITNAVMLARTRPALAPFFEFTGQAHLADEDLPSCIPR